MRTFTKKFLKLREGEAWEDLSLARQTEVDHALRDFRLGGVHLPPAEKARFAQLQSELAKGCARFTDHVTDATQAWSLLLEEETRLAGVPENYRAMMQEDATAHQQTGWRVNLTPPCVQAILTHAEDRALRREVFEAHTTRASDQGPQAGQYDNTQLIDTLLELRYEQAQLLGFETIADHALTTRMAQSTEEVLAFLNDLLERARPLAQKELKEAREFAQSELGLEDLQRWDLAWTGERMRAARLDLRDEEVKPYFSADATIAGMLDLAAQLFQLQIVQRSDVEVWHPDVQFHEIRDADGDVLGQFYLDPLCARRQTRRRLDGCVCPAPQARRCSATGGGISDV